MAMNTLTCKCGFRVSGTDLNEVRDVFSEHECFPSLSTAINAEAIGFCVLIIAAAAVLIVAMVTGVIK